MYTQVDVNSLICSIIVIISLIKVLIGFWVLVIGYYLSKFFNKLVFYYLDKKYWKDWVKLRSIKDRYRVLIMLFSLLLSWSILGSLAYYFIEITVIYPDVMKVS